MNDRAFNVLRALKAGRKTVQDLWPIAGNNPAESISQLRRKGFKIHTHKVPHITKEGRNGWHGEYELLDSRGAGNE